MCRVKATYTVVDHNLRRAAAAVDSRFNVSGKAAQAAQGVRDQAEAVNDRLGLKRKLRTAADDVKRKAPMVRQSSMCKWSMTSGLPHACTSCPCKWHQEHANPSRCITSSAGYGALVSLHA